LHIVKCAFPLLIFQLYMTVPQLSILFCTFLDQRKNTPVKLLLVRLMIDAF
jgi:hypothetical protein